MGRKEEEKLIELYEIIYKERPAVKRIGSGGSPRRYYRLAGSDGKTIVGVVGDDIEENKTFLRMALFLWENGINVPKIIGHDKNTVCYLLEDLGDISLFDMLKEGDPMEAGRRALDQLLKVQLLPESEWREIVGYKPFGERIINWDLNYFKYDFLKPAGITFDEDLLEDDFEKLRSSLMKTPEQLWGLMYRDYQSRNIMVKDGEYYLIDFQGARRGPVIYDAVSFIWQAKATFTIEERERLMGYYTGRLAEAVNVEREKIDGAFLPMLLFRTLQVFGAYGFRGLIERKQHFLESLPAAQRNLKYLLDKCVTDEYPELKKVAERILTKKFENEKPDTDGLTLTVFSFSYKKGYPEDRTGNGGGFMFDCRGMHNPGRYEEFKPLTGKDREVIEFLEEKGEVQVFVSKALDLVRPTIENYLQRGFNSLQVGFGCTGGRHRSVYCAGRFASLVAEEFPEVKIRLIHREQA